MKRRATMTLAHRDEAVQTILDVYNCLGVEAARRLATEHLRDRKITPSDYIHIARWSEGRAHDLNTETRPHA